MTCDRFFFNIYLCALNFLDLLGIIATIGTCREIQCLPYAGYSLMFIHLYVVSCEENLSFPWRGIFLCHPLPSKHHNYLILFWDVYFWELVLLTAHVKRLSVSRMRDFYPDLNTKKTYKFKKHIYFEYDPGAELSHTCCPSTFTSPRLSKVLRYSYTRFA